MNDQVVTLLSDAHIAIVALDSHEFAVFGGANGFDEGAEVHVIDMGVVDLHLACMKTIFVDRGEDLFGEFERDIDADGFNLGVGTDNLLHREGPRRITASIEIANLTNKVALYNFLSTFSGTHFLQPRTIVGHVGFTF